MKKIILIAIIILIFGLVTNGEAFPSQCDGKRVTCELYGYGTCTAMYCPPMVTYDEKGNVIEITKDCNTCTMTRRCWCEGYSFEITE